MPDHDILFASIPELGRLLTDRKVSSVELATLALDSLNGAGRKLNAVAELTRELALAQAKQADEERAAGKVRSPLHGIPWGAKDLLATAGIPTRWGSPAHKDQVFDYDAAVVERLREAGAVLVAKLAMVELAGGGGYEYPSASLTGPCRNPWNPGRWAGGSSSGSGAAVGGGLVPFAIGTETWGSITVPGAFCSVSGLRPTYGRVSRHGAMALSWTMDKIGPMCRTADDCGLVLAAIAGPDPRDPSSYGQGFRYSAGAKRGRKLRLGILPQDYKANQAQAAGDAFSSAAELFHRLGHTLGDAKLPDFPYDLAAGTIVSAEGSSAFENLARSTRLELLADKSQQAGLMAGLAMPAPDYLRAMRIRTLAAPAAARIFDQFDALIAPTLLHGAPPIETGLSVSFAHMGGNGGPGNLLGWPSITVPMGFDSDHLPLGLEVIGPPYGEAAVLSLAAAFQRETDWHLKRPDQK